MRVILEPESAPIKLWITDSNEEIIVDLEPSALEQLKNVALLPFIHKHIAVMPDVHWGNGASVGTVIPTIDAIIPAAVGVDIGCGMMARQTSLKAGDLPDDLGKLRARLENVIPVGGPGIKGSWKEQGRYGPPASVLSKWKDLERGFKTIIAKHPKISAGATYEQLGTLGTGNHFIEICLDQDGKVWVMLHSGSRGPGNRIGMYFITKAKEQIAKAHIELRDNNLAYLVDGSDTFVDYIQAVGWAQVFAFENRILMLDRVLAALRDFTKGFTMDTVAVNCHHNYISKEEHFGKWVWITRKGAVSARPGEMGIIPGSMGEKSFIVQGKGNKESFHSCSHGAGRRMSRTQAKKEFTLENLEAQTKGVECRKDVDVIDEIPAAYKNIDRVMEAQRELVEVKFTLKQVLCVKG